MSKEKVAQILDKASEKLFPKVFEFQTDKFTLLLTAPEIVFFEVRRNTLDVHSMNGCHEVRLSLKKVKEMLADFPQFVQTHGSFIVNLDYYNGTKDGYIILSNGHEVKLSRTFRNSFFEALSAHVRSS